MATPNFSELEQQILADWKKNDIFGQTLSKPAPRGRFVFYDGPPTANGKPHIGHVETRTFKDIIPRFKTMQGYRVERKAGWDTQGLPVEIEVEKQLGISGKKGIEEYGVEKFNAKARESVWKYKGLWEQMTERIGFWLDTDHPYITYSNDYIETLWWIFKQAWEAKLLEQDFKVVPYCPRCGTALSSHEVAQGYQSVTEPAVYVKFELVDEPGTFVLAWTTTPWTLPGNVALAVDQDIDYVKVKSATGDYLIIAKALSHKLKAEDQQVVATLKGSELIGKSYRPLFDGIDLGTVSGKKAYFIADADFVTTEDGTGVVHTAVMYGVEDFDLGKKLDLPTVHTVDLQGKFTDVVKPWAGREVRDADGETQKEIIAWLEQQGKLYQVEDYTHDYPFCWRCKHPLLYYAKTTWFIRMTKLQDRLIANNQQINWYPNHIKDGRFGEWLREVKDWAISRERYWGTPLPIWTCDTCQAKECHGSYMELSAKAPTRNRYLFVRHGESTINVKKVLNTVPDKKDAVPLTATGVEQAHELVATLQSQGVQAIYSSEFRRAYETANIVSEQLGIPVVRDARINEYRIGDAFEGRSHDEFHAKFPTTAKEIRFTKRASPEGETWRDVRDRLFDFLHDIDQQFEGKTILVVTHADPILIVQWAASFAPENGISKDYPHHCQPIEIRFPASMYRRDGTFDPHRPGIDEVTYRCPSCEQGTMTRTTEVADTWFDSGSMPFAQWHYPFENIARIDSGENYPADYISEAIDQTRGWFYTLLAVASILQARGIVKEPPFKNVVVLGHINDAQGRKLSKSLGNYVDPMELIEKVGADAVRWYLVTTNQPWDSKNFDLKFVEEGVRKTFLILLNVLSFWELYGKTSAGDHEPSDHILDRWMRSRTAQVTAGVTERLERYDMTGAARDLAAAVTDISTWYVRRSRDRMKGEEAARVASTLHETLLTMAKLMAPFTPFLAEHIYRRLGGAKASVHLEDWPAPGEIDERLIIDMEHARSVVEEALSLRAAAGIKVRQPLQQLVVTTAIRPELDALIQDELNIKEVHHATQLPTEGEWQRGTNVALDVSISDELRNEGHLRDLVREFNALRKEAGLQPADQIIAFVPAGTRAAQIVERYSEEFLRDVRARAATPSLDGATHRRDMTLDGPVTIGLAKV